MTYRSDGGAKCAKCARGFSPDDLQLHVSGAWMCVECTRHTGADEANASLAKGLRSRRRMQLFGVSLVALAALIIGWRALSRRLEDRRRAVLASETQVRIAKRLDGIRAATKGWRFETDRPCDVGDMQRRARFLPVPYVEATRLDGGMGWAIASNDFDRLLGFEHDTSPEYAELAVSALGSFDRAGVMLVLAPRYSGIPLGAVVGHWSGYAVFADATTAEPLCWRALSVQVAQDRVTSTLTREARVAAHEMAELELRY